MRILLAVAFVVSLHAQSPSTRSVTANGSASVFAAPDQAVIDVSVSTRANTAQDAASRNADAMNTLLGAIEKLIGGNGDVKSTAYYISPNYVYPPNGGTPSVNGYTATSSAQVTLRVLTYAGPVIDTAVQNGATTVGNLSFSLRDPDPQRIQALKLATAQARAHADAMATAAGRTVGAVATISEGTVVRVTPIVGIAAAGASTATPVQPGLIEVQASVTLVADLN